MVTTRRSKGNISSGNDGNSSSATSRGSLLIPLLSLMLASTAAVPNPEDFVNILGGTKSKDDMSHGNILPETQMPWGFNGWAPLTDTANGNFWFYSESRSFHGIRCTHQPSPWIGDYGFFRVMPSIVSLQHDDPDEFSAYDPTKSTWLPYYQQHTLLAYGSRDGYLTVEVVPTEHGAIMRFNFPPMAKGNLAVGWNQTRRVLFGLHDQHDSLAVVPDAQLATMQGTTVNGDGKNFSHHFYATVGGGKDGLTNLQPSASGVDSSGWGYFDFAAGNASSNTLVLRIATSMISPEQATINHAREVEGLGFDTAKKSAQAAWHELLSRVDVADIGPGYTMQEEQDWLVGFYSSLYRAAKYPRKLFETDITGQVVHLAP